MGSEIGLTERRFAVVRNHLDELGYRQPLMLDSIPLVEQLVSDLLHTTESLRHYKELAQQSFEECSQLERGIEPYKADNSRLVQECNELHLKLLYQKEESEEKQKDLKSRLRKLESENSDLEFLNSQHLARVKSLEVESAGKTCKILELQSRNAKSVITTPGGKKSSLPTCTPSLEVDSPLKPGKPWQERFWSVNAQAKDPYVANMSEYLDQRVACLAREVNLLKEERKQQSEIISTFRNQLNNRDREIQRLSLMLQGGRPIAAVNKDCCYQDIERRFSKATSDKNAFERRNNDLENQLKEAISKQHEAMNRALKLADHNKKIEQEMRDIDHMALAVEAECNSTVKENTKRVSKMQEQLEESLKQIHDLERELLEQKRYHQECKAELEAVRNEKQSLQKILENTLEDKKKMNDRINNFTIIEQDLNTEIDRLTQAVNLQRLRIADLESRLLAEEHKSARGDPQPASGDGTHTKPVLAASANSSNKKPVTIRKKKGVVKKHLKSTGTVQTDEQKSSKPASRDPSPSLREILDREREDFETQVKQLTQKAEQAARNPKSTCSSSFPDDSDNVRDNYNATIERLQTERDYYCKENQRLKEQLGNVPEQQESVNCELRRKLEEKEQCLMDSRHAIRELTREKHNLTVRLEHACERGNSPCSPLDNNGVSSIKAVVKRLERERDMARGDVQRLEEERDALRERLKIATETQVSEHARLEKAIIESEERVRKLEGERRELMSAQGAQRASINNLEEQLEVFRDNLRTAQHELTQQRMLYTQIKTLQEQTDRALADSQGQLTQAESELANAKERVRELERDRSALDREVAQLKNERTILRGSLAQLDQEKDGLLIHIDNKTERAAQLEQELKAKENRLLQVQDQQIELEKKLDIILDENAAKEQAVRNSEAEVNALRQDLTKLQRTHENSLREIRRLNDDVASATQDVRLANHELELSRQEVENLKRQLQDYVAEVRRAEEVLQQKEGERGELLEHFRSLSMEATVLESNNHSLEQEAEDAKNRLRSAEHRITDLEVLLETKDSLVRNYESQISDLSSHIAGLETQLQSHAEQKSRLEADLSAVRDLCVKLDSQKDDLIEANTEGEVIKMHLENELSRMREEQNHLQELLSKDRATVESLEDLLATSRQETIEGRMANQELQSEVAALHRRMDDLQERLDSETAEVRRYQTQAAEYSQQIAELRRDVTNEKFERARMSEESRRASVTPRTGGGVCPCGPPPPRNDCPGHTPRGYPVPSGAITRTLMPPPVGPTASPAGPRSSRQPSCDYSRCPAYPPSYRKPTDYGSSSRRASWEDGARPYGRAVAESYSPTSRPSYGRAPPPVVTDGPQPGQQTVHCVFTSSGPAMSSATANYTIVRRNGTETTGSTITSMATRNGSYSSAGPPAQGSKVASDGTSSKTEEETEIPKIPSQNSRESARSKKSLEESSSKGSGAKQRASVSSKKSAVEDSEESSDPAT